MVSNSRHQMLQTRGPLLSPAAAADDKEKCSKKPHTEEACHGAEISSTEFCIAPLTMKMCQDLSDNHCIVTYLANTPPSFRPFSRQPPSCQPFMPRFLLSLRLMTFPSTVSPSSHARFLCSVVNRVEFMNMASNFDKRNTRNLRMYTRIMIKQSEIRDIFPFLRGARIDFRCVQSPALYLFSKM